MVFPDFFSAVEVDQRVQRLDRDRNDDELARLLKKHEEVLAGEMELGKEPDKVFLRDSERFLRDFNGFWEFQRVSNGFGGILMVLKGFKGFLRASKAF